MARRYLQAFALGIPLVYALLLALAWDKVGTRDFDQFFVFHQLQDWNYQLFGFAKQWTPLLCSGLSLAGEPQVPLLSLSMLLSYAFGAARGTRSCHHPLPCLGLDRCLPVRRVVRERGLLDEGCTCQLRYDDLARLQHVVCDVMLARLIRSPGGATDNTNDPQRHQQDDCQQRPVAPAKREFVVHIR